MIYKAPLDEKTVSTDWIENIFDGYNGVECKRSMLGFVDDYPVCARWDDNVVTWEVFGCSHPETVISTLFRRLNELEKEWANDDYTTKLHAQTSIIGNTLIQSLFIETED